MASQKHLDLLKQGKVEAWNEWREKHRNISITLSKADFSHANLAGVNLSGVFARYVDFSYANLTSAHFHRAYLRDANFSHAILKKTDFSHAELSYANFNNAYLFEAIFRWAYIRDATFINAHLTESDMREADFIHADLSKAYLYHSDLRKSNFSIANLSGADLSYAWLDETNLRGANFSDADLTNSNLSGANISEADFSRAKLIDCNIYAISAWDVKLTGAIQSNLIIEHPSSFEPIITVDNLDVAQFIYLLLNNKKIRDILDTVTSKVVLLLGRFTTERKVVLDALREELRKRHYVPVLFDFEKPSSRDLTETVSILAHLARFIIVDLTDPSSAPHEVATVVPQTVVPVQPLLTLQPLIVDGKADERREYAMFEDLRRRHHWVLPTFRYQDTADLLASLQGHIIEPAELKAQELAKH